MFALVEERRPTSPELRLVVRNGGSTSVRAPGKRVQGVRRRSRVERVGSALAALAILAGAVVGAGVGVSRLAAGWFGGAPAAQSVVVEPGQSLWSLAQEVDPKQDPRRVVGVLRAELGTDVVHPGEVVRVPR